jgi:hypothetical protein
MENILKYENKSQLYEFLVKDFGFVKIEERYDPDAFGNFFIILSSKFFSLRYINDRSYLTIEVASNSDRTKWLDLSFVRNFIYQPKNINPDENLKDNYERISELNNFIKNDFDLICDLYSVNNYLSTRQQIDNLLRQQFNQRFP